MFSFITENFDNTEFWKLFEDANEKLEVNASDKVKKWNRVCVTKYTALYLACSSVTSVCHEIGDLVCKNHKNRPKVL